jgi:tetratricopeptide (TPR) repeat protein
MALLGLSGWSIYRAASLYRPPEAAKRWYDEGVAALRDGTYLKAANALGMAVKSDPRFALAHARLADAWAELDSTGHAQQEMLVASAAEQQIDLSDDDKRYVNAVHATLVRDYSAAAQDYEEILKRLPGEQKADGLVDLGRVYEKAGKIKETLASYEKAAELRPDEPAPFVHLGIWKSRQRDPAGAEAAFKRAEELYRAKSNQEGLAEVAYQRGYAANEAADSEHARQYLEQSLAIARQINSPQLEARTLSQLSSVAYNDSNDPKGDDKAIDYANQAIQIASGNGLEYWEADSKMRLANAYLDKGNFANAEQYAQLALHSAKQNQHPRIEASAELTLASIDDQRGAKREEQIAFANDALNYYQDFGFMDMAASASSLLVRGEQSQGDYKTAYQHAQDSLRIARTTNSRLAIEGAEETIGSVALDLEDYPDALNHFEHALALGRLLHVNEAYTALDCADVQWRLGRYQDAEETLASISAQAIHREDITSGIASRRAQMLLSQRKFREALSIARAAIKVYSDLPAWKLIDFEKVAVLAEANLGQTNQAWHDADSMSALASTDGDQSLIAQAALVEAELFMKFKMPDKAIPAAEAASQYFSTKGKRESEWLSHSLLAAAAHVSGNSELCSKQTKQANDILKELEHTWGTEVFHDYAARPDHRLAISDLTKLRTV